MGDVLARLPLQLDRFETLGLRVTHCWLPRGDFEALCAAWLRRSSLGRLALEDDALPPAVMFHAAAGLVEVAPHDSPVTAWGFQDG